MNIHNDPNLARMYCQVCNGTGAVYQEHADGTLSEHVCPYCQGARNSTWVRQKFDANASRTKVIKRCVWGYGIFIFLMLSPKHIPGYIVALAWLVFLIGLVWVWLHPSPSKRRQKRLRRGPDPMTTNKERLMGGAVLGGAVLKGAWEQQRRYR